MSLPKGRHSAGLRRLAVGEAVPGSFDQAHDAIERRCGNVLGKRRLEELVVTDARSAAHRFADRLPWLTTAQRDEVIRVYTADHLDASRTSIYHLAERSRAMQREYTARYTTLRARLLGLSLADGRRGPDRAPPPRPVKAPPSPPARHGGAAPDGSVLTVQS